MREFPHEQHLTLLWIFYPLQLWHWPSCSDRGRIGSLQNQWWLGASIILAGSCPSTTSVDGLGCTSSSTFVRPEAHLARGQLRKRLVCCSIHHHGPLITVKVQILSKGSHALPKQICFAVAANSLWPPPPPPRFAPRSEYLWHLHCHQLRKGPQYFKKGTKFWEKKFWIA